MNRTVINSPLPFVLVLAFSLCVQQNRKDKPLNSNRTLQQFFTLGFRDIKAHRLPRLPRLQLPRHRLLLLGFHIPTLSSWTPSKRLNQISPSSRFEIKIKNVHSNREPPGLDHTPPGRKIWLCCLVLLHGAASMLRWYLKVPSPTHPSILYSHPIAKS